MAEELQKMSIEELQTEHRKRREESAVLRQEMDQIEAVLAPKQARVSAVEKVRRAGLSKLEIEALREGVKDGE